MAKDEISELFNSDKSELSNEYSNYLLEQYKLYVELSDRLSSRRVATNTFFLTVNTALITIMAVLSQNLIQQRTIGAVLMSLTAFTAIVFCFAWYRILSAYKQLNAAKFKVIHELEKRLPARIFEKEWEVLGKGEDPNVYMPLTNIERIIPILFVVVYLIFAISVSIVSLAT
ncbi:MAG: hypothetical protein JRN15_03695 [Nitrososphaerota archaeon]|nr:hypothetical protein [Nitrososphaerota archaeon]